MFPDYQISALIDDLRRTRSLDLTVENILDGRLQPTLPSFQQEPSHPTPSVHDEIASDEDVENKFENNPTQRQRLLKSRKQELMEEARSRFIRRRLGVSDASNGRD